jgi:peroxiredoxin
VAYGACDGPEAKYAKRITVVVGPDGRVEQVHGKVDAKTHPQTLLESLAAPGAR